MTAETEQMPSGAHAVDGVVHRRSPYAVAETVERLNRAIDGAGAKLFVAVDHSGEAKRVGLSLRETKLLIFGNPAAGTPAMVEAPTVALDLPLKILVWEDDATAVWMTYLSGEWLARRHGISTEHAQSLSAADVLTSGVATPS